jgi:hypothetical protein
MTTDTLPPLSLSDEQIIAVRKQQSGRYGSGGLEPYADSIAFARAILRAALPAAQPIAWLCCGSLFHAYDAIPANMLPPMGSPVPLYAAPVAAQPTSGVPVAPAGYALVPLEPTPAMFAADAPEDERPGDFGTMKYRRGIWKAMLAAAGVMAADEPLRWEFTGPGGLKRFLTQKQYEAQTPGTQEWYRPICPKCGPAGVDSSDGGQKK